VVCAGLAKTGTTSLAKALRTLGYSVYDYREHFTFHRQEWLDSFETDRLPNFKEMYQGVDAITDVPPAFWFEEIAGVFPEAKVVLTVRDSEEAWLKSWKEHLQMWKDVTFLVKIALWWNNGQSFADTLHNAIYGSFNPEATVLFRKRYQQHNERVQAVIPAERLLVFNVKQGWKPLCEFLGCDIPSTRFPRENAGQIADTKNCFAQFASKANSTIAYISLFGIVLFAAIFIVRLIGS